MRPNRHPVAPSPTICQHTRTQSNGWPGQQGAIRLNRHPAAPPPTIRQHTRTQSNARPGNAAQSGQAANSGSLAWVSDDGGVALLRSGTSLMNQARTNTSTAAGAAQMKMLSMAWEMA